MEKMAVLADRVARGRVVVLTGAGVSTESGIPDYRSPEALARPRRPITGPEFLRSAAVRRRYWARASAGWERIRLARPGPAHQAIAALERRGAVTCVITQNVDRLHQAAGSRHVVELHGALAEVTCLDCGRFEDRDVVQSRLREANAAWNVRHATAATDAQAAPDGDADLSDEAVATFEVPHCATCGGVLKPHVVFFGESVPRIVVDRAFAALDDADALLVAGTSLAVFSGYRFLRRAAERGIWIGIVNRGPVRGEDQAALKIEASTGRVLTELASALATVQPLLREGR
jgi:NAD-dependent deacetylase sirtuin 4